MGNAIITRKGGSAAATVQTKTGTVTISSGTGSVTNIGFKPDAIIFDFGTIQSGSPKLAPGVNFTALNATSLSVYATTSRSGYTYSVLSITQSSNGFSVQAYDISGSSYSAMSSRSISYTAIKYS